MQDRENARRTFASEETSAGARLRDDTRLLDGTYPPVDKPSGPIPKASGEPALLAATPSAESLLQIPRERLSRADLHLHSSYSYDVLNLEALDPRTLYRRAVELGMGFFTLTDHETLRGVEALAEQLDREYGNEPPIPLIFGTELKVKDERVGHTLHVNVLGLDRRQFAELTRRRRQLDKFLSFCRSERLYHAYNHPFWFEGRELGSLSMIEAVLSEFPVVELNAGRTARLNERTFELARRHQVALVATSDSHTGRVGRAYTLAPGSTAEEFLRNVSSGLALVAPRHITLAELNDEVQQILGLVFSPGVPFAVKRTFLREHRLLRRCARSTLASSAIMRPGLVQRGACAILAGLAYPATAYFLLQQRWMDWELDAPASEPAWDLERSLAA